MELIKINIQLTGALLHKILSRNPYPGFYKNICLKKIRLPRD